MNIASGIPLIGGLFDNSDQQAMSELQKNQALYNMALPDFEKFNPEQYRYQGDYTPESMAYQTIQEDPRLKDYQMQALAKMSGLADTGMSAQDQLGYEKARRMAEGVAQSGAQSAMQNAQARGVAGSGMEYALRNQAAQGASDRAQMSAMQQASDSARQRALYEQAFLQGTGNVRAQDQIHGAANANIINQFNQANTQNRNQAQQLNLGNRQNLNNSNVDTKNNAFKYNQQMQQQNFANQLSRATGQSNANTGVANGYYAQNAANTSNRNANTQLLGTLAMGAFGGAAPAAAPAQNQQQQQEPYSLGGSYNWGPGYQR